MSVPRSEFETGGEVNSHLLSVVQSSVLGIESYMLSMVRLESKYGNLIQKMRVQSPTIGSDGMVYVGSKDGKLYAINGKTGIKIWEFETGDKVISLLLVRMVQYTSVLGIKTICYQW